MPDTLERICQEGIHWHPVSVIEKYSIDQTAWAERRNAERLSRGDFSGARLAPQTRRGIRRLTKRTMPDPAEMHGSYLQGLFREPEDGYAHDEGNLLTSAGLLIIINLLIGSAQTSTDPGIRALTNAQTVVGVGATSTAANVADVKLGADAGSAYYQQADGSFPTAAGATITNQCTFASGNANFAWNEWCWCSGVGTITPGASILTTSVYATNLAGMWNHKIPAGGLGTKASGASWVFTTTIVFS